MIRFFSFFTRNWGLKLLSLILAIVVYYSMKEKVPSSGTVYNPSSTLKGPANGGE